MPFTRMQAYANSKKVKIVGDMPIYVGGQSADVWAHQELFELTPSGAPANVSGVPPDAFSETGQLWGSPLYDWPVCADICTCSSHSLVQNCAYPGACSVLIGCILLLDTLVQQAMHVPTCSLASLSQGVASYACC